MAESSVARPLLKLNAQFIAIAHSVCSLSAFLAALFVGYWLHFYKIVQNEHYGYPDEWFPSVSATIGDRYPERSIFQILIALTSGPRFLLLFVGYIVWYKQDSIYPKLGLVTGLVRTVTCGGWVYITSTDDHDFHDIFMISYIVLTIPWDMAVTKLSPPGSKIRSYRKYTAFTFFFMLVPLIYLFIQHKVHRVAGAYSYYAYCEWSLIFLDVGFDAWSILDFKELTIEILPSSDSDAFFVTNFSRSAPVKETKLQPKSTQQGGSLFQLTVDVVNAFIFWSIYSSLFLLIWYFPLWHMGISGYEAACLTLVSPALLVIPGLSKVFVSYPQFVKAFSCTLGVGSYLIADPAARLLTTAAGISIQMMSLSCDIWTLGTQKDSLPIKTYATTFILGLVLSAIAKFAFWANNPIWPIMNSETGGWNLTGLVVGVVSAFFTKLPKPVSYVETEKSARKPSFLLTSLGFGSLIYSISAMLTDSSTIILWNWEGYPIRGPIPVPHGAITLITMCAGAFFGLYKPESYKTVTFSGVLGGAVLYLFNGWVGYVGGLAYAFWLCYVTPLSFQQISKTGKLASIFAVSFLFTVILSLMHVWVVAYAFVPGGPLLRERTDIVLGLSIFMIVGLVYDHQPPQIDTKRAKSVLKKLTNHFVLLVLLSCFVAFTRFQFEKPKPYHPKSRLMTAGIWTIHFGLDNDMWASEHRMRDLIKDLELDVVGLLESDTQRIIMGNRDLTQRIAEELGMYADFGPGPNKHTWGAALLSKFPIVNSTHHLLPSPVGELAPAIHATLDCYGELIDVVVFHSGQEEDVEDRRLQTLGVTDIMGSSDRPMVLLSYLVTDPLKGNYNTYVSDKSGMHDIDVTDDDRWCEYILYKKMKRTGYARVSRGTITDTEVQVGKFVIPDGTIDESYSQTRVDEDKVPEDMRFPSIFYGDGVRGHQYHVFDEPRYFR
ncbi:hypothetical protein OGAPHI_000018 [Ogataea philodendri]|uniref:Protein CWH43 n=1 Tax=Ogataea philodendri TaxID=1378263 RepID=A0A9P8PID6_9ASCO|nr:uncharacterized protein OGAPHI_000018 [Ogataea philodendri]KAH3671832.1 hypothetical protein OGAPHI_000018 [Ogataea philodendri]